LELIFHRSLIFKLTNQIQRPPHIRETQRNDLHMGASTQEEKFHININCMTQVIFPFDIPKTVKNKDNVILLRHF